ncbi:hypothetical protein [Pseudoalteromonas peptidolytica]|nr:hypothetical protein [Pseudoalteromonas peptidolytica]MDW7549109.1 hypothetical protein [Pseudoalteromonas peptidolytica]
MTYQGAEYQAHWWTRGQQLGTKLFGVNCNQLVVFKVLVGVLSVP